MGLAEKTQHAIRRSTRLSLEVPVLLTSLDDAVPLSVPGNTTLVNAHGCGVVAEREFAQGMKVQLEIVPAKRRTAARVAVVVPLGGDPATWLVGLELDVPGNFWGIEYAPSDWKIEESASPGADPQQPNREPSAGSEPVRTRRWRLTDISAGACYLETAAPFPVETPVLLSIRVLNKECLLDGVVRVSHARTGMGVELTRAPEHDQRAKVEELVDQLLNSREVPRIFAGRKEGQPATLNPSAYAAQGVECPDPLLNLVREGESLTTEQFLSDLRAHRLGKRRDPRIQMALPVLLSGTDVTGRPLDQRVMTVNISRRGALLEGIHGMLAPGDEISLTRGHKREQFRVAWVGREDSTAGQIGVAAVDPNASFWDEVREAKPQSALEHAQKRKRWVDFR